MLLQPLGDERMAVGRKVALFPAHWKLCLGISTAAQCGEVVEWLLHLDVDNTNMIAKDDTHLYVRK